ncbi:MAG: C4-type zinc ribbon domain-containing protein [Verrucomicrobia bacterium]|nr:C4-type zinc ribbon domain-containing protein [Verrucomicrobiota bacterium]MDA1064888.1 C4-type zinc ribbon domain-containing protein [Verrucomicrobiota bacterium]
MINQQIEKLLILQDRDQVVRRLQDQLESIPTGIQTLESEMEADTKALEDSKAKLQHLEVQRNELDLEVKSAQDKILKYKNQQLLVKKNEEYQALTHEIELTEKKILVWEEEEIGLMLEIDEESNEFSRRESVFDSAMTNIRNEISTLEAKKIEVQAQLTVATTKMADAKTSIAAGYLSAYERLGSRIRLPVVVPINIQNCGGCHLRVSNETLEQSRKGEELTTCDNCGRVVYLAS